MVAGIITQILQVNPDLGPRDVWQLLTSTASQSNSPDNNLGWGIVNADAAIRGAVLLNRTPETTPLPHNLIVHTPYPNPFQNEVHFVIDAIKPTSTARLILFDLLGREIAEIYEGAIQVGGSSIKFDGAHLPAGIYTYVLEAEDGVQSGILTRLPY